MKNTIQGAACGDHRCYVVRWEDARTTKLCTAGMKMDDGGAREII